MCSSWAFEQIRDQLVFTRVTQHAQLTSLNLRQSRNPPILRTNRDGHDRIGYRHGRRPRAGFCIPSWEPNPEQHNPKHVYVSVMDKKNRSDLFQVHIPGYPRTDGSFGGEGGNVSPSTALAFDLSSTGCREITTKIQDFMQAHLNDVCLGYLTNPSRDLRYFQQSTQNSDACVSNKAHDCVQFGFFQQKGDSDADQVESKCCGCHQSTN